MPEDPVLYCAMDWLYERQDAIESALAARHLERGGRVLYDLSSSWMEGSACPLVARGHSRDGKRGKPQIEYGLLTDEEGRPIAVEVFKGKTRDPTAFISAVKTTRERFGLEEITFVGDRGMIAKARVTALSKLPGASWITALRAPDIKALVSCGAIQMSLFDEANLAEITHPDYQGERLVVCRNPELAERRAHARAALLDATDVALEKLRANVEARRLKDHTKIALRAGRALGKYKMAKHFDLHVEEAQITWSRRQERIDQEAATDGIYVIRSPLALETMSAAALVGTYKSLAEVEADFRSWKATDLDLRPIFHFTENRMRAHVLLCMLAGYLTWHLGRAVAPLTFTDTERVAQPTRPDPVGDAHSSESAKAKAATKHTKAGEPVYSYQSLLEDLKTLTRNTCRIAGTSVTFGQALRAHPHPKAGLRAHRQTHPPASHVGRRSTANRRMTRVFPARADVSPG
jgi:transposase